VAIALPNGKNMGSVRNKCTGEGYDDLPPHDLATEKATIGCILLDSAYSVPILIDAGITCRHFYDLRYAEVFAEALQLYRDGRAADTITLSSGLKKREVNISVAELEILAGIPPTHYNVEAYIPELQDKYRRRLVVEYAYKASSIARDPSVPLEALRDTGEQFRLALNHATGDLLPSVVDSHQFTTEVSEKPEELVQGLLYRGSKLVLGGGSKSFKTWTLIDLALSVAYGVPWFGLMTRKGRVLYVNFELQGWAFEDRVRTIMQAKQLKSEPGMLDCWNLRGRATSFEELLPQIKERIEKDGYSLVILDPIYKLLGNCDENSARDTTKLLNAVEDLAACSGAAVCFGHHFSKGNQSAKESIDRVSGSGVYARDPDSLLIMTQHREPGCFVIEATLRNFKPMSPFVVRWNFPLFERDESLDPQDLKQAQQGRPTTYSTETLLDVLGTDHLKTVAWQSKAQKETGIKRSAFYELMRQLKDDELIHQDDKKRWYSGKSENSEESLSE
jgi:hypothetical protein